jgi:hypothetical protein
VQEEITVRLRRIEYVAGEGRHPFQLPRCIRDLGKTICTQCHPGGSVAAVRGCDGAARRPQGINTVPFAGGQVKRNYLCIREGHCSA